MCKQTTKLGITVFQQDKRRSSSSLEGTPNYIISRFQGFTQGQVERLFSR